MNFLLIAVDCLRADRLGCNGYHRDTTPFMDELASQSALFERCFAPAIPTQPSFTTLFTGQLPTTHGIVAHRGRSQLAPDAPFLPEILQQHGYATVAVDNLADHHQPWFARGFESYFNPREPGTYPDCFLYNRAAIDWLKYHRREPFFLSIHYWDPHVPYMPPAKYRNLFYDRDPTATNPGSLDRFYERPLREGWVGDWLDRMAAEWPGAAAKQITDIEFVRSQYDAEVRCADDGVRELITALENLGLLEDTAVILLGDHGEELGEHGIFFDHHGLYDSDIHVPLMIRWPKQDSAAGRFNDFVQHADLAPTILQVAGIPIPDEMDGTSLTPLMQSETEALEERVLLTVECTWMAKWAIRHDGWKFIQARAPDFYGGPMQELYDLTADPGEQRNLADQQPQKLADCQRLLEDELSDRLATAHRREDPVTAHGITLGAKMFESRAAPSLRTFYEGGFDFELLPERYRFLKRGPIHRLWKSLPSSIRTALRSAVVKTLKFARRHGEDS